MTVGPSPEKRKPESKRIGLTPRRWRRRSCAACTSHVDRLEVTAAAELGLVEAASSYDSKRGVQFKTFAYYRIRGAVYDCLRKMNWVTGAVRRQLVADRGTNDYLRDYTELAQPAPDASSAGRELERITASVVCSYLLSLESLKVEIPSGAPSAEQKMQGDQERQGLSSALAELPPNNRQVMEEYYFRDLSLEQIGAKLNPSKSWVCRIHAKSGTGDAAGKRCRCAPRRQIERVTRVAAKYPSGGRNFSRRKADN